MPTGFARRSTRASKRWSDTERPGGCRTIGQINLARIAKKYAQLGINTRMFSDPDEAFKWLEAAV